MEQYITKKDLEKWFQDKIKEYPHSLMKEHLEMVEHLMFNPLFEKDKLTWKER